MTNIVSTPTTEKTSPNFRMTKEQKEKLKVKAKLRGEYLQDYMDKVFENLDKIDELIYG